MRETFRQILPIISFLPWPLFFYTLLYLPYQNLQSKSDVPSATFATPPTLATCPQQALLQSLPCPPDKSEQSRYQVQHQFTLTPHQLRTWMHDLNCQPGLQSLSLHFAPNQDVITLDLHLTQSPL